MARLTGRRQDCGFNSSKVVLCACLCLRFQISNRWKLLSQAQLQRGTRKEAAKKKPLQQPGDSDLWWFVPVVLCVWAVVFRSLSTLPLFFSFDGGYSDNICTGAVQYPE